jgi:uncharacterized alpha-E superfamily protein
MGGGCLGSERVAPLTELQEIQEKADPIVYDFQTRRQALEDQYTSRPLQRVLSEVVNDLKRGSSILQFWRAVLKNCENIRDTISHKDVPSLRYLKDLMK